MFSVWRNQLDNSCESLQYQIKERYYEIQKIEDVISTLHSLSGMNHVATQLKVKKNELEEQQQKMQKMVHSLMEINRLYRTAENRILDQGDACRVWYKYSAQFHGFISISEEERDRTVDTD